MSYYFFCASLPELLPTVMPEWSEEDFLAACRLHLGSSDSATVEGLASGTPSESGFAAQWVAAETQMRNAIARERGKRRQREVTGQLREHSGYDTDIEVDVAEAFAARTPREREKILDTIRWKKAEEIEDGDMFGMQHICAYLIKLRIAARWGTHDQDAGLQRIEALLETDNDKPQEGLDT